MSSAVCSQCQARLCAARQRSRPAHCRQQHVAHAGRDYFGNEGMRSKGAFGGRGGGSEDLAKLLSGGGGAGMHDGLDLSRGLDLSQNQGDSGEDPLNYDPEGLFKGNTSFQDGHIQRRMAFKNAAKADEMEKELAKQRERDLVEADKRRANTVVPSDPGELVNFFLNCEAVDMEYFVAKARHLIDDDFWAALDNAIGQERFLPEPNEDTLAELEGLRSYVKQLLTAQDSVKQGVQAATERLKRLLTVKDKKQCILDMAAANEIDQALMQLLQQNISGAEAAGQRQAAEFMTKIRNACAKYVIKPAKASTEEDRAKALLQEQQAVQANAQPAAPKGIIMP